MQLRLRLSLPSEARSVPLVRRVLRHALVVLGVAGDCVDDIELAVTEACTNVLDHVPDEAEYEVVAGIEGDRCVLEVIDEGGGFAAPAALGQGAVVDPAAESGRGLQLMRALVDHLAFDSCERRGTVVRMEKALSYT